MQAEADEWCTREPQFTAWPPRSDAELRRLRVAVVMDRQCSWWVLTGCWVVLGLASWQPSAASWSLPLHAPSHPWPVLLCF